MQCPKLTSARQPQADDLWSGLTEFLKHRYQSARMADGRFSVISQCYNSLRP